MTVFINVQSADRAGRRPDVNAFSTYVCHPTLLVHAILGIRPPIQVGRGSDSQDCMDRQEAWQSEVKPGLIRWDQSAGGGDPTKRSFPSRVGTSDMGRRSGLITTHRAPLWVLLSYENPPRPRPTSYVVRSVSSTSYLLKERGLPSSDNVLCALKRRSQLSEIGYRQTAGPAFADIGRRLAVDLAFTLSGVAGC